MQISRLEITYRRGVRELDRGPVFVIRWYTVGEWQYVKQRLNIPKRDMRNEAPEPSKNVRRPRTSEEIWGP